ncbi:flagellar hook-basal body complex protein [Edwardsiella anguillarum]|nr:flagellar hook-basal body complex protein [Edwardsiella anguillarum]
MRLRHLCRHVRRLQGGSGVTVASVNQDFKDGTTTTTNRGLDVAISGQGFFRMQDPNGSVYYTRNGQFSKDAKGFLTNARACTLPAIRQRGRRRPSSRAPIRYRSRSRPG